MVKDMHMNTISMGLAVITGASSGIGVVYADRLARRGYELLLVAPHRECMDDLAKKLGADTQRNVEILAADSTNTADLAGPEPLPNLYGGKPGGAVLDVNSEGVSAKC
jgi:uncharacterized protein